MRLAKRITAFLAKTKRAIQFVTVGRKFGIEAIASAISFSHPRKN